MLHLSIDLHIHLQIWTEPYELGVYSLHFVFLFTDIASILFILENYVTAGFRLYRVLDQTLILDLWWDRHYAQTGELEIN